MYETAVDSWPTPRGAEVVFEYRLGTTDWGVIDATVAYDEYDLAALSLTGWAFDIGAYVGSVAISLALDNPGLRVLAVEPVPENVDLCRRNVARNGLVGRVHIIEGAIGLPEVATLRVDYAYTDSDLAKQYAFVGHIGMGEGEVIPHKQHRTRCYSLSALAHLASELPSFVKLDCEGGEWLAFGDPVVTRLPRVRGEWHAREDDARAALEAIFAATHDLTVTVSDARLGLFVATRREASLRP